MKRKLTRTQIRDRYGVGTPRYEAAMITHGFKKPHYIGGHTKATARAMVFAITNTKPAFRTKAFGKNWKIKLAGFQALTR